MAEAIVIYRGPPKNNSWIRWMVARVKRQNKNNLIAIVGKTGSGKTYSAMSICERMSKIDKVPFTADHIVFSLTELMELINSGKLKRGSKIIFDEPQVSISAREFQSKANKVFNYLLSTFRHRNLTLFFCTPFESLLDKNTRKLFHARFETVSINPNTKTCRLSPRYLEYSDYKDEPYRKRLIVLYRDKNGKTKSRKVTFWDVPIPSKKLIEAYEKKKTEFTDRLNRNILLELKEYDESGKSITAERKEEKPKRKPLTEKQGLVMKTLANLKVSNKLEVASKILGISPPAISLHKKAAEKKGYSLEEFKENNENFEKNAKNT